MVLKNTLKHLTRVNYPTKHFNKHSNNVNNLNDKDYTHAKQVLNPYFIIKKN